jgi:hypothetical protein
MSSKFGLLDDPTEGEIPDGRIDLSGFPPVQRRAPIDLVQVDAAAAHHGFISREATPIVADLPPARRRRRAVPAEATRYLAIRMVESQHSRFINFADKYELTYHDAIKALLDAAGE